MLIKSRATTSFPAPLGFGNCEKPAVPEEVVIVKVVLAAPAVVLTEEGLKPQFNPAGAWHEKVTLSANPSEGVTVTVNRADCPAVTLALGGIAPN